MSALHWVAEAVVGGEESVVCECRRCGTTVNPGTEKCPTCNSDAIARYRLH